MPLAVDENQIAKLIAVGESAQARDGFLTKLVEAKIQLNSDISITKTKTGFNIKALNTETSVSLDNLLAEYLYIATN
jgi:hypothetical protein